MTTTVLPLTFPERLFISRHRAQVAVETLAEAIGCSTRSVRRYERGETPTPFPAAVIWAEVCRVPLEWLAEAVTVGERTAQSTWIVRNEQGSGWRDAETADQLALFGRVTSSTLDAIVHRLPCRDRRHERLPWPAERERRRASVRRLERAAS